MNKIELPKFETYEEEATFWDNLDTAPFMEDDGEWFHFEMVADRAIRVAIIPELAKELIQLARVQGVSVETLVNVLLVEQIHKTSMITTSTV